MPSGGASNSVWELPAPTQAQICHYIKMFASRAGEPLGLRAETMAKSLGKISYAEAEEFCYGVRRRHALSMGEKPLKTIVAEQLKLWKARARQPDVT